ncbi:hypothetical protein C7212DRAFT_321741 [Tuber magnatum]|uniref:Cell wall protein n=1 Tax=Tuber magnatum TaxID=42249 RepID=A0A317SN85_9PEZI|nr:hypothetical protein C7212DRAFT_321741 [Tuber magnatum]
MRSVAPIVAIAFLAALVAGQSKVLQIDDGQVQGPEIRAGYPCPVPTSTPCPVIVVPSAPPKIQIHKPAPSAPPGAPRPPIAFEGGALARKYPVGGAVAVGAVAVAFAMI